MYSNLSQPTVELEPALRHAISHSLSTPGALLHKQLRCGGQGTRSPSLHIQEIICCQAVLISGQR